MMSTSASTDTVDEDAPPQMLAGDGEVSDEDAGSSSSPGAVASAPNFRRRLFGGAARRGVVFVLLPAVALLLASGAAWLKWWDAGNKAAQAASSETIQAATETTIALLSYQPDTVDKELVSVRDRLTGAFRDSYTSLTNDVVIPGAKQKRISAVATVPAAASVSATKGHAVVLVMVNQTTMVGTDAPTQTASSIKVTLDRVDGRWLISDFTPI